MIKQPPKDFAALVLKSMKPKHAEKEVEEMDEDGEADIATLAADDLIAAVQAGDASGVVDAFRELARACKDEAKPRKSFDDERPSFDDDDEDY